MGGKSTGMDWSALALATIAVLLALFGSFAFGGRLDQFHAILVVVVLQLVVAGIYFEMRKQD
jgi:hypothetical protein